VAVVAGGGNNGGDGYVIARHISLAKVKVTIYTTKEIALLSGDTAVNAGIAQRMGIENKLIGTAEQLAECAPEWHGCRVIVDALLGTGFEGPVRDDTARVIDAINRARAEGGAKVVAVDIPSGLDCDRGVPGGATVRADVTVTFVAMKAGFANPAAREWTGRVEVAGIGAPAELVERVRLGG
jgi:NAD(P)H-hydrate epimerase